MENEKISATLKDMEETTIRAIAALFHATSPGRQYTYEKGIYRFFPLKPTKALQNALSIDREVLSIVTNFDDLQARTISVIKNLLEKSQDRYERSMVLLIHNDRKGSYKLKNWGRENGLSIISLLYRDIEDGRDIKLLINNELYNHDPFDITGPVSNESEFFGRRDEAISFARRIQKGTVNSILGIRKTGKTSIINRVIAECGDKYSDLIIFVDCSRDDIWNLDANKLLKTLYNNIKEANTKDESYISLLKIKDYSPILVEEMIYEIDNSNKQVILIFDEFDYITPSSPTNSDVWGHQFNQFWRQMRVVFQEICRRRRNFSIIFGGVTSKWFRVAQINDVENAAANLIPEEYLKPLQENAVMAMIRNLGNRCGLSFERKALEVIYNGTSGIPSWIRKVCSYINRKIPVENRPLEVSENLANQLLIDYISGEGISYSKVAIDHLFTVFPEIKKSLSKFINDSSSINPDEKLVLESYGIINPRGQFSGNIMRETINFCLASNEIVNSSHNKVKAVGESAEWADEIAELAKRQNIIERSLRKIILEMIRSDSRSDIAKGSSKDRILNCLAEDRKKNLHLFNAEVILEKTFWSELENIIKKEWRVFESVFKDQGYLSKYMAILNNRPYAHAKNLEPIELLASKNALKYIEDLIYKYENA